MTFKLNIRGRDIVSAPTAANPANPLIGTEHEADLSGFGSSDETPHDLVRHTISRLAGLAARAIETAVPTPHLSDAERERAEMYHQHHFGCRVCIAAGQGRDSHCDIGKDLWTLYQTKGESTGTETGPSNND